MSAGLHKDLSIGHLSKLVCALSLSMASLGVNAYNYLTCSNGKQLNFNNGYMTFNYANNLTGAQKNAISVGLDRVTAFSDSNITTIDNNDSSFSSGNGQNEIYRANIPTADCTAWFIVSTCTVTEADIRFGNPDWTTTDNSQHLPFSSGRSITGTAVHEGGHCIGMSHSNDRYNMMGSDWNHVTRNGTTSYYGPGEDLSNGLIELHGKKSATNDHRDVGITIFRYQGVSGEYSAHKFGELRNTLGAILPVVGSFEGQSVYQVFAGNTIQMELTLENNGELDTENPNIGIYLSTNSVISADDTLLDGPVAFALERDSPTETTVTVTIPSATTPGNYFVGAYIDHDNLISETTSANNVAYYPVTIVAPPGC
jgi:hypothetical protein